MARARAALPLSLRIALRELRGGLAGFRVFLMCLAIGVAAIAGVGSVSAALDRGIAENGREILGGDIELHLVGMRMGEDARAFLEARGRISEIATLRAMARAEGGSGQAVVEIKAVDRAYPLFGTLALEEGGRLAEALRPRGGAQAALVEETFLARLGVGRGERFLIGEARFVVAGVIAREPDRLAGGFAIGPRVMMSRQALDATRLVRPGSLVHWHARLKLAGDAGEGRVRALVSELKERFPGAGWRLRERGQGAPGLDRFITRLRDFLMVIGLTALVVGGVGVANAVSAYLERKTETIATLKCLGARGRLIIAAYLAQVLLLALGGSLAGAALGAAAPLAVAAAAGGLLPVALAQGLYPAPLATGVLFGLLVTCLFALWPLGRAREIRPAALFRDTVDHVRRWPRPGILIGLAGSLGALMAVLLASTADVRFALVYAGAITGAVVLLVLMAEALKALARALPVPRAATLRLALAALRRPGSPLTGVVLSFGLGLGLMVTVALIDRSLSRDLIEEIPARAPSFFFLDIQRDQLAGFRETAAAAPGVGRIDDEPMLRGRIVALDGVPAERIKPPPGAAWVLRGDRGITYSAVLPENSELEAGQWWPAGYEGEPLVSFVGELAHELGLSIGSRVSVNVLGRTITARIANFRAVDWGSLGINFVMVFSPNALADAPHTHLATVTMAPEHEQALLAAVVERFPNITAIPVRETLGRVHELMRNLLAGLRAASAVTLASAGLVLAGAMAAGQRTRLYEASILKALGARRRRLIEIYLIEYLLLGLATAVFAALAGTLAAYVIVSFVIGAGWTFAPGVALTTVTAGTLATIVLGLAASWRILGRKPAPLLRAQ